MNRFFLILWALFLTMSVQAQFVNYGATITIQPGATLRIETSFENQAGTIDNQGTLEVLGNFTNAAGAGTTLSGNGTVKFIGDANSDVTTNGDALQNVEMAKTAQNITLQDPMTINGTLTFTSDNNKIILGSNDLTIGASGSIVSSDDNEYVVTGGTGRLVKTGLGTTAFTYPVGFDASTYNPVTIAENGTVDNIAVRVLQHAYVNGESGTQINTEAINATWSITETNPGNSNLSITAQWTNTDELQHFTRNECGIGKYNGTSYDLLAADLGVASGSGPYTRSRSGVTPGNFMVGDDKALDYVAVNVKVFLGGPSFAANEMGDQLRVANLVPLSQPYSSAPYNATFAHAGRGGKGIEFVNALVDFNKSSGNGTQDDAVDWVFLELRSNPTTVVASKTALLQRDGDVVEAEDGSPVRFYGLNDGNYHVVVRHRNHLRIMTNSAVVLSHVPANLNLTDGSITTYGTGAQNIVSGIYSMWAGDVNSDGQINATDRAETWNLRNQIGFRLQDCSMNGTVDATDRATTWNNRNKTVTF